MPFQGTLKGRKGLRPLDYFEVRKSVGVNTFISIHFLENIKKFEILKNTKLVFMVLLVCGFTCQFHIKFGTYSSLVHAIDKHGRDYSTRSLWNGNVCSVHLRGRGMVPLSGTLTGSVSSNYCAYVLEDKVKGRRMESGREF